MRLYCSVLCMLVCVQHFYSFGATLSHCGPPHCGWFVLYDKGRNCSDKLVSCSPRGKKRKKSNPRLLLQTTVNKAFIIILVKKKKRAKISIITNIFENVTGFLFLF